jgi:glycosyltransferase involved in cell wall biosynthesis
MDKLPVLYIVIPCYNEEEVLPLTAPLFREQIARMADAGKIDPESRILFVNDGSKDGTWAFISRLAAEDPHVLGLCLSRNRGQPLPPEAHDRTGAGRDL